MTGWNWKRITSIIAGVISALGFIYAGGANLFGWPLGDQIQQFAGILVSGLSMVLAAVTGQSVSNDKADTKSSESSGASK